MMLSEEMLVLMQPNLLVDMYPGTLEFLQLELQTNSQCLTTFYGRSLGSYTIQKGAFSKKRRRQ